MKAAEHAAAPARMCVCGVGGGGGAPVEASYETTRAKTTRPRSGMAL